MQTSSNETQCNALDAIDNPIKCCQYPSFFVNDTIDNACALKYSKLNSTDDENQCWYPQCITEEAKILEDGKFNKEKFIEIFSESSDKRILSNDWRSAIRQNIEKCENEKISLSTKNMTAEQCFPEYFIKIVACTLSRNFVSCPVFKGIDIECLQVKGAVEDCLKAGKSLKVMMRQFFLYRGTENIPKTRKL